MDNREIKTYDPDHPGLVRLSGRLYGTISYVEHFDIYVLDYGDNVLYNEKENRYQDGFRWKKNKFKSYDDCLNFCREHDIKIVDKYKVKSPFSNGLPDPRFLSKRTTPYSPDELVDISMLEENKQNKQNNMKKRIRISENTINKAVKHSLSELFNRNNNQQSDNVNSTYTQFTTRLSDMLYQYEMLNSIMGEQGFLNSLGQQGNEVKKYIEMSRQFIEYACYGGGFGSGNNNLGVTPQHKSYFKTTNNAQFDFQNILGDIYYQYSILDSLMSTNGFINSLPNGKNIYKYISSAKDYIERACSILGVSGQHKSYMSESRKRIRLSETDLKNMVKESVRRIVKQRKKLNEAEDYGWVVESSEAREAYDFACEYFGQENLNQDIVDALSTDELAACLAFIFRMNDFREWDERNGNYDDDEDFEGDEEI